MPLYMVHNFWENFTSAIKTNDNALLIDLLCDELAKMIVFERGKIVEIVKQAGISVSPDNTDEHIVSLILANCGKNEKLKNRIVKEIIDNHSQDAKEPKNVYNGNGLYKEQKQSRQETINLTKRNSALMKGIAYICKPDNKDLIITKIKSWKKLKDKNLSIEGEKEGYTKKQYKRSMVLTGMLTGGFAVGLFFLGRFIVKRYGKLKFVKDEPATSPVNSIVPPVTPAEPVKTETKTADDDE